MKWLCVVTLLYLVINYWEGMSWNNYLLLDDNSSSSNTLTPNNSIIMTQNNNVDDNHSPPLPPPPPPPTISPTLTTLVPTLKVNDNDDNNDLDTTFENYENNNSVQSPTAAIITQPSSSSSNLQRQGPYLSVYDAFQQIQPESSSKTSTTSITTTSQKYNTDTKNSFVTWFQRPNGSKWSQTNLKNNNSNPNHDKNSNDGSVFVRQWCDITGTTWYPKGTMGPSSTSTASTTKNTTAWQLRAPYFVLPGAAYSGTVYMSSLLHSHPQIIPTRTKELQFFHDKPFRKYIHPNSDLTLVNAARQRMYARDYNIQLLQRNTTLISFDATPGYLYYSTIVPRRILCVEPWIQMVLLLRNPVDRVLEQYYAQYSTVISSNMNSSNKNSRSIPLPPHLSLDACIQQELNLMREVGLLYSLNSTTGANNNKNNKNSTKFYGSKEEDMAWYKYQTMSHTGGLLGRSMYVIQLRHWIMALRMAGRIPSQSILIVYSENFALQPQKEYNRMLQFLNIVVPHKIPVDLLQQIPVSLTHQTRYVSDATRQILEDFFRPYNQQLQRLLVRYNISSI
jgi:hypothetical protein